MSAAQWLRTQARRIAGPLRRSTVLTAVATLALVGQAWLLSGILSAALFAHATLARLWPEWLGVLALVPVRFVLGVTARRGTFRAAQWLARSLRERVLRGAQALGPYGLRVTSSGDLITRLVDGIDAVLAYFARYLPQAGAAVLIPPLLALFVFPADWISGLILLLTAPLIPLFMVLVGRAAERASERRYGQLRRLGAAFVEALGALVTLRQLGAAQRFAQRLQDEGESYRALTMQVLRVAFLSALVLEFFATVSIAMVAVLIGFRLLWGELHLRAGLFVLLLAPEFYLPLRALGGLRHARMDALAAAEQLMTLETLPTTATASSQRGADGVHDGPPQIRIEALGYVHGGRAPALQECSMVVRPRCVTALVGSTGAGKSTLLNVLMRFIAPTHGGVWIDECELSRLDPAQWRTRVAWVPQQAHIFEGSVRENLQWAAPAADARALERAAAHSGLDAVLRRLPRGWETPLGERGLGLSGGELQRLALARALLRESAQVWLLDEPTAHLDAASARSVDAVIRRAAGSRTVLLAAHRLSAALAADWVVVLRGGRVVEQGAPAALAAVPGAFAALLRAERT